MPDARTPPLWGLSAGVVVAAVLTTALVLVLGGGAPRAAPAGLPDASAWVTWSRALVPTLTTVAAALTVGFALLVGGHLGRRVPDAARWAIRGALVWAALALTDVGLGAAELSALSPGTSVTGTLADSVQVQALVVSALLALLAAGSARRAPRATLPLALAALAPQVLTGHVRTADLPLLAGSALVVHVVAASLWVGGLAALGWLAFRRREEWGALLPRYSALALGCVLALAVTGTLTALGRLTSPADLVTTAYGVVVTLKALLLVGLAATGWLQRRHVVARGGERRRDFAILGGSELVLMSLVLGLAAGLSQTPPP